jgi:hypothetical protein
MSTKKHFKIFSGSNCKFFKRNLLKIEVSRYRNQLIENGQKNCEKFQPEKAASSYAKIYACLINNLKLV